MRFGLIGKTLKHSFSRSYFTEKFITENITDCVYDNFELSRIEELPQLLHTHPDLKGFNITIPYKEQIIPFLNGKNEMVAGTGACNCVKLVNGKLYGFNTDVIGFRKTLEVRLKPSHKKALVLGTGGASKAVQYALKQLGIPFLLVSRQPAAGLITYNNLGKDILSEYALLINTTPMGMYPDVDNYPPLPYEYLTPEHFLYDLIYNPEKTQFLIKGEHRGAQICNGFEMLVLQAEESWKIWMQEDIG
jgi:shikimate dehydrogenase